MTATQRTPKAENRAAGGRGPSRQRALAFMATRTKEQWASVALDTADALERLVRVIEESSTNGTTEMPDALNQARKALKDGRR